MESFKELEIGRWRQFREVALDFHDRMTVITGANGAGKTRVSEVAGEATDRASHAASEAKDAVTKAPQMLRQQTRGNPKAAGLIAFGGGLLLGSLLPETSAEHDIARRIEPTVSGAMSEAREAGRDVMEDVKGDAEDAMEQVKDKASEAGQHLRDDTKEAAERGRDRTQG